MALIIMSWKMNIKLPKISLLKALRNDQTFYVIKLIQQMNSCLSEDIKPLAYNLANSRFSE